MSINITQMPRKVPPKITLGDRTRIVRRELGLTQAEFAAELAKYLPSVKDRAYGAWEAGINEPENKVEVCEALEKMTGYPREWFLGWTDNQGPTPGELPGTLRFGNLQSAESNVHHVDFGRRRAA